MSESAARQEQEGWGTGVVPRLAVDLKNELPEQKGFSERNLARMVAFFRAYPILPQAAALLESRKPAASPATLTAILPQAAAKLAGRNRRREEVSQGPHRDETKGLTT
jgi:hypothetical protein